MHLKHTPIQHVYFSALNRKKCWLECLQSKTFLETIDEQNLNQAIDNTSIDSFIAQYEENINENEKMVFKNFQADFKNKSLLFGRTLFQELLSQFPNAPFFNNNKSLSGLFLLIQNFLLGGLAYQQSLLLRRCTHTHLEYELLRCAHRRFDEKQGFVDFACEYEALVFKGFIEAFFPNAFFSRKTSAKFCKDEILIT